jgi:hypothetical protein
MIALSPASSFTKVRGCHTKAVLNCEAYALYRPDLTPPGLRHQAILLLLAADVSTFPVAFQAAVHFSQGAALISSEDQGVVVRA